MKHEMNEKLLKEAVEVVREKLDQMLVQYGRTGTDPKLICFHTGRESSAVYLCMDFAMKCLEIFSEEHLEQVYSAIAKEMNEETSGSLTEKAWIREDIRKLLKKLSKGDNNA